MRDFSLSHAGVLHSARRQLLPVLLLSLALATPGQARDLSPGFFDQSLTLPGMPAAVMSADMTGDGIKDLVILVAYRTWDDVSTVEQSSFDDIEGMVEVMTVVSELLDKRELRVYPGREGMGFDASLPPLELDTTVHALATGHPAEPLIAITDEGIAAVRGFSDPEVPPSLELLFSTETSLSGTGSFYSGLTFLQDLDEDGLPDLLLPTVEGWTVFGGTSAGFQSNPSASLIEPEPKPRKEDESEENDESEASESSEEGAGEDDSAEDDESHADESEAEAEERPRRPRHRLPIIRDVNGDGRLDLHVLNVGRRSGPVIFLNTGDLAFAEPREIEIDDPARKHEDIVFVGDLSADGTPDLVSREEHEVPEDAGWKKEVAHAKRPNFTYRLYRLGQDLTIASEPHHSFEAIGYTFEGQDEEAQEEMREEAGNEDIDFKLPGGFQDLDGDGRLDLVAITLDFSILPMIMKALLTGHVSLQMDFHPWCQGEAGDFSKVPDLDLSGKFKISFRRAQVKHLSQFAGDFNADGRADFVQLGRGRKVTIHSGGPNCTYPDRPDRTIKMAAEPKHLGLVRILDLDKNQTSDIFVVHPGKNSKTGESRSVRLDLYLGEKSPANQGVEVGTATSTDSPGATSVSNQEISLPCRSSPLTAATSCSPTSNAECLPANTARHCRATRERFRSLELSLP